MGQAHRLLFVIFYSIEKQEVWRLRVLARRLPMLRVNTMRLLRVSRRRALILGFAILATFSILGTAAQEPGYPPSAQPSPQAYETESPEQLQQLVAPVALYPDSLVASILAASSFPAEITEANGWLAPRANFSPDKIASEADQQNWDPSVKALLPFPPVLQNLASNLSWTSELGDAYHNQPADVMNAIQVMRRQAKKAGTLRSNTQNKVVDKHGYITIEPASQEDVYVPAYNPWAAYGYAIDPWPGWVETPGIWWGGPGLSFGVGFGIGPFLGYGWGWNGWGIDWYNRGLCSTARPIGDTAPPFSTGTTTTAAIQASTTMGIAGVLMTFADPARLTWDASRDTRRPTTE